MKAIRKLHFAVLPFCLLLLAIAVARAETGVTDTEIRIGMWTPLSGPVALLGQSARDAVRLWAKEVNDKGGIHGRKINFISYDDAASPQEAQATVRRLIDQDQVFMLISGSVSGSTLPVRQVITREKVPFVSSISSNMNLMRPFSRYIFRIYANEDTQALGIIEWMMEHEKLTRPAILYTSNDYGVGGFQVFSERLKEKYKISPAAAERYNQGDQDFSAQLLRIKGADPDGLLIYAFAQEAGIIVRQAKELGISRKAVRRRRDLDAASPARRRARRRWASLPRWSCPTSPMLRQCRALLPIVTSSRPLSIPMVFRPAAPRNMISQATQRAR